MYTMESKVIDLKIIGDSISNVTEMETSSLTRVNFIGSFKQEWLKMTDWSQSLIYKKRFYYSSCKMSKHLNYYNLCEKTFQS
jgi:hypothetical protein